MSTQNLLQFGPENAQKLCFLLKLDGKNVLHRQYLSRGWFYFAESRYTFDHVTPWSTTNVQGQGHNMKSCLLAKYCSVLGNRGRRV